MGRKRVIDGPEIALEHGEKELIFFEFDPKMPITQILARINADIQKRYGHNPGIKLIETTMITNRIIRLCYEIEGNHEEET